MPQAGLVAQVSVGRQRAEKEAARGALERLEATAAEATPS